MVAALWSHSVFPVLKFSLVHSWSLKPALYFSLALSSGLYLLLSGLLPCIWIISLCFAHWIMFAADRARLFTGLLFWPCLCFLTTSLSNKACKWIRTSLVSFALLHITASKYRSTCTTKKSTNLPPPPFFLCVFHNIGCLNVKKN